MSSPNDFSLCPRCGSRNIRFVDNKKWVCPSCGFDLYNNVAASVAVIIADRAGTVLLETRAKEPRKGFLALPGGFVDQDETAEHAAVRECGEETGCVPAHVTYVCSYPNTYEYKGFIYKTCDLFFEAELAGKDSGSIADLIKQLHVQKTEVVSFTAATIKSADDIALLPLAFDSARNALCAWITRRNS